MKIIVFSNTSFFSSEEDHYFLLTIFSLALTEDFRFYKGFFHEDITDNVLLENFAAIYFEQDI